jgi:hypothetical protein
MKQQYMFLLYILLLIYNSFFFFCLLIYLFSSSFFLLMMMLMMMIIIAHTNIVIIFYNFKFNYKNINQNLIELNALFDYLIRKIIKTAIICNMKIQPKQNKKEKKKFILF